MKFYTGVFAVAGLIVATGPIIIHLLNRRRFRVVNWAAMDFLKAALQRNRRVLQMRDLILMALRILCLIVFGVALARPYFQSGSDASTFRYAWLSVAVLAAFGGAIWAALGDKSAKIIGGAVCLLAGILSTWGIMNVVRDAGAAGDASASSRDPVHAVILVDNSLSMAYQTLDGSLLDKARERAEDFIGNLPPESRISIVPSCGSEIGFSLDAYRNQDDAREALERIEVVSRSTRISEVIDLATQACDRVPELEAKRVVFISDQQLNNWLGQSASEAFKKIPELQIVPVTADNPENAWVSGFRLVDGIADAEIPSRFIATVSYHGRSKLPNVQVNLSMEDTIVASKMVDLTPGQTLDVEFTHRVDATPEVGRASVLHAKVEIKTESADGDRLEADNARHLSIPVVATLPVVFVDQVGPEKEDPTAGLTGESSPLRRYLSPVGRGDDPAKQLFRRRYLSIDQLDHDSLDDVRLVVISGVESPEPVAELLREYVLQGGTLLITAGGDFDLQAWNEHGWNNGLGIMPLPLKDEWFGESLEDAPEGQLPDLFVLDFDSMRHSYFRDSVIGDDVLRDDFTAPYFWKAAMLDENSEGVDEMAVALAKRIAEDREFLAESDKRRAEWDKKREDGSYDEEDEAEFKLDESRRSAVKPEWLLWRREETSNDDSELTPQEIAHRSRPSVLARYKGNGLPFLAQRKIGYGTVMFQSSALQTKSWTTLSTTNAMYMYTKILQGLVSQTLPNRNYEAGARIVLPAESGRFRYVLSRPNGNEDRLRVEALGAETYGVSIRNALVGGLYRLTSYRVDPENPAGPGEKVREVPLSINGPGEESELSVAGEDAIKERLGENGNYRWIADGEEISLEGAQIRGRDTWKLFMLIALICLLTEMLVLAWPGIARRFVQQPE